MSTASPGCPCCCPPIAHCRQAAGADPQGAAVAGGLGALLWQPLLGAGHQVIAYDLRGHGHSTLGRSGFAVDAYAQDLLTVLDHFDVRHGVVVAHSTGGIGADPAPDLVEFAGRLMAGAPRQTTIDAPKAVLRFEFRERLDQVTLPTLILAGSKDRSVEPEHTKALADGIPRPACNASPGPGTWWCWNAPTRSQEPSPSSRPVAPTRTFRNGRGGTDGRQPSP